MNAAFRKSRACATLFLSLLIVGVSLFSIVPQVRGLALVASGNIQLIGNAITFDGFDSADPAHSTAGFYDPANALTNGDIAGNGYISIENANVRGRVFLGPTNSVMIAPNGYVTSGIFRTPEFVTMYDVAVPFTNGVVPLTDRTINGTNYASVIGNGSYLVSSLNLASSQSIYVGGAASLFVIGNFSMASSAYIYVAPGASLKMYVGGSFAHFTSIRSTNALAFAYYGLSSNTSVVFSPGTNSLIGTFYAPNATVSLSGGGDIVGSVWAKSVSFAGHPSVHFDENLSRYEVLPPFITQHPTNQTVSAHANVSLSVGAQHVLDGHYQWRFNGADIPGAISSTLIVSNVVAADAGGYSVVVSNAFGLMESFSATLSITSSVSTAPVLTLANVANGFGFNVGGITGTPYAVETSTNLIDWQSILTNTAPFTFTDTNVSSFPQRFYRAVYLP